MDGRPNRKIKASFSNSFYTVCGVDGTELYLHSYLDFKIGAFILVGLDRMLLRYRLRPAFCHISPPFTTLLYPYGGRQGKHVILFPRTLTKTSDGAQSPKGRGALSNVFGGDVRPKTLKPTPNFRPKCMIFHTLI